MPLPQIEMEIPCLSSWNDGLLTINPARIIYSLTNAGKGHYLQSGFAYGTTQGHVAVGEVIYGGLEQATDDVYFRSSFARPGSMLAWLGKPYMLLQQQKFRRLAGHAIKQATEARYANCTNN